MYEVIDKGPANGVNPRHGVQVMDLFSHVKEARVFHCHLSGAVVIIKGRFLSDLNALEREIGKIVINSYC